MKTLFKNGTFDMIDSFGGRFDSYGNYHEDRDYDEYNELVGYTNSITEVLNRHTP